MSRTCESFEEPNDDGHRDNYPDDRPKRLRKWKQGQAVHDRDEDNQADEQGDHAGVSDLDGAVGGI